MPSKHSKVTVQRNEFGMSAKIYAWRQRINSQGTKHFGQNLKSGYPSTGHQRQHSVVLKYWDLISNVSIGNAKLSDSLSCLALKGSAMYLPLNGLWTHEITFMG